MSWVPTCLPVWLDGVEGPEGVAAAGDIRVPPELRAGQLQHLPEERLSRTSSKGEWSVAVRTTFMEYLCNERS